MLHRISLSTITLTFLLCTSTLSLALEKVASDIADPPNATDLKINVIESSGRTKRDLSYEEDSGSVMSKRPRQFVGKRDNDLSEEDSDDEFSDYDNQLLDDLMNDGTLMKEFSKFLDSDFLKERLAEHISSEDLRNLAEDVIADDFSSSSTQRLAKRPRQFVGKRDFLDEDMDNDIEKRPRQFVGKRARQFIGKRARQFIGKRPRQFVGKRADALLNYLADQQPMFGVLSKRPRQFVGKRESDFALAKRPRQFVGKRESLFDMDKRPRQFVGKRGFVHYDGLVNPESNDALIFSKRPRQFVGKRSEISKRPRQFVGKRSDLEMAKRPRQFVGKRSDDSQSPDAFDMAKRPRQFVGRR